MTQLLGIYTKGIFEKQQSGYGHMFMMLLSSAPFSLFYHRFKMSAGTLQALCYQSFYLQCNDASFSTGAKPLCLSSYIHLLLIHDEQKRNTGQAIGDLMNI